MTSSKSMAEPKSLYDQIGGAAVAAAITEFYRRAFTDGIIGHFFFGHDQEDITGKQIDFATALLGGPRRYKGKPLEQAHSQLAIGQPHFGRRQVLMAEVLTEMGLEPKLKDAWLSLEEGLRPHIMRGLRPRPKA